MKIIKMITIATLVVYFTACTKEALEETPDTFSPQSNSQSSWKGEDEYILVPIFGSIQNVEWDPIPEATVSLSSLSGELVHQAVSDSNGAYVIHAVQTGSYEMKIVAINYQDLVEQIEVTDTTERVDIMSAL